MSINALAQQNTKALDLFAIKPAAQEPRATINRPDAARQDREGGFEQALRESSNSKRSERESQTVEARDKAGRSESELNEPAPSDEASSAREGKPAADQTQGESDQSDTSGQADQAKPEADTDTTDADLSEAVEGEAVVDAQTQAAQAAAHLQIAQQGPAQDTSAPSTTDGQADAAASKVKQQAQAALHHATSQAQAQSQSQQNAGQTQAATAAAVQPVLQQDTQAQDGNDQSRGESSSTTKATAATNATGQNSAASATFAVPDQPSGEARLPINTPANAQQIEAAKAMQAQPLVQQDDNDAVNTARLTRGLANAVQQRGGVVTLRLTPPEMGTVRIQMQITGANISASFHAESASAQTLLTQQISQLRTALETQGMHVDKLSVQPLAATAQSQNASQNQNDSQQQQQNQAQHQSANDGRSRGQYSGDSSDGRSSGGRQDGDTATGQHQTRQGFFDQLTDSADSAAA